MGDRANFGFRENKDAPTLFLYGHWAGYEMLAQLAHALEAARPRWNDPAYGTRIAISHMIGTDWASETGWGLSIDSLCDNEHSVPVVDWQAQTVSLYEATWSQAPNYNKAKFTMSLDAFVKKFSKTPALV